jgi:hypothetical protein
MAGQTLAASLCSQPMTSEGDSFDLIMSVCQ